MKKLTIRCLVYGWAIESALIKTNKKISTEQQGSKHDNMMNERRRQPSTAQKKNEHIARFKLFLHGGINTVHKFLGMRNVVCMHVTYIFMHAICDGLIISKYCIKIHSESKKEGDQNSLRGCSHGE